MCSDVIGYYSGLDASALGGVALKARLHSLSAHQLRQEGVVRKPRPTNSVTVMALGHHVAAPMPSNVNSEMFEHRVNERVSFISPLAFFPSKRKRSLILQQLIKPFTLFKPAAIR